MADDNADLKAIIQLMGEEISKYDKNFTVEHNGKVLFSTGGAR